MRCGSLFTGIRGLDIAVEALGFDVAWHAEIDKDASMELERLRPDVPNYGDVMAIDYSQVEPVEALIGGGWPCQPFSGAGRSLGTADPRYLWPEVARAVRSLRPRYFYMEQVTDVLDERRFPGVFSRCLADLAEAGMDARWGCLRSSDVGAPHGRHRLFLAAYARSAGIGWNDRRSPEAQERTGWGQPNDSDPSLSGRGEASPDPESHAWWISYRDRLQASAYAGSEGREGPTTAEGRVQPEQLARGVDWREYESAIRRWERVMGPAPMPFVMVEYRGTTSPKLNPKFSAWMMALEPPRLPRRSAVRCVGNAVNPIQAYVGLSQLDAQLRKCES